MIGTIINDRYHLKKELGQGGMGIVYCAHDITLDRNVAIKILTNAGLGADGWARLLREARAIAKLNHPNIVTVHDVGEAHLEGLLNLPGLVPFIVMEYVEGVNLYEQPPEKVEVVVAIAQQLCAALAHAHANGIIHRDLKPENVIIAQEGIAKLMDFGLSRSASSRLTKEGTIVGTVSYMSPEQAFGENIDDRADLYSLGVMLYELTTGELPFSADDPVAVITQHIHAPVVPPRAKNDRIPPGLDALIVQLMSKNPEDRPTSAEEVLRLLKMPEILDASVLLYDEFSVLDRIVRGRIVGREKELHQARQSLMQALRGEGQLLLISGEPGVGKSRLMYEIVTQAEVSGGQAFIGESQAEGNAPYAAIAQITRRAFTFYKHDGLEIPSLVMADLITIAPELRVDYPDFPPNPPLEPDSERRRLFESLARFITLLSKVKPLLLVLEDIHWADSGTLALLQFLAQRCYQQPVMLLGTYREVELDGALPFHETLLNLNRKNLGMRLKLERLDQHKTRELLAVIFAEEITPEFLAGIFQETEGNPFFIEEVCKALVESGELYFADGQWHRPDMADITIPQSIKVAVQSRLAKLSETAQEVLLNAAVIGREFDYKTLLQVTGTGEDALIDILEAALKTQLIEELKEGVGERFWFSHALIPAALRESISGLRRTRLHRKVAQTMEAIHPQAYQRLAYHWGEGGDEEKGLTYTIKAADQARRTYANQDAIRLYSEALALLPEGHPAHFDLLEARVAIHDMTANREAQIDNIEAMLSLAKQQGDDNRQVDALLALAKLYLEIEVPKAREPANRALEIARQLGDSARQARASSLLGIQSRYSGDPLQSRQHLEKAIVLARTAGLSRDLADYLCYNVTLHDWFGDYNDGLAAAQEAVTLSKDIDDKRLEMKTKRILGGVYWSMERYVEALALVKDSLQMARSIGDIDGEVSSLNVLALIKLKLKLYGESEAHFLEMLQVTDIFSSMSTEYAVGNIRTLYIEMGDYEKYLHLVKNLLEKAHQARNEFWISHLKESYCDSCFSLGNYRDCLEIAESNWPYIEKSLGQGAQVVHLSRMGFFAAYAGSLDLAYQYLQAAQSRWDDLEEPPLIAYVMLNIAEVARLDGRPEAIHAGLEQASQGIETLRKFQDRPDWSNYLKLADLHMALSEEDPAHAFEALVAIEKALEVIEEFPEIWLPPEYLYFTASKVLRTNKRLDEADDYLRQAYERVMLVAGNIKDDDLRRSYLKNVPVNRDIVAETNARGMVT